MKKIFAIVGLCICLSVSAFAGGSNETHQNFIGRVFIRYECGNRSTILFFNTLGDAERSFNNFVFAMQRHSQWARPASLNEIASYLDSNYDIVILSEHEEGEESNYAILTLFLNNYVITKLFLEDDLHNHRSWHISGFKSAIDFFDAITGN